MPRAKVLTMASNYLCAMCDGLEAACKCDVKDYCALCHGDEKVRLCEDGQYYCELCREICDYHAGD